VFLYLGLAYSFQKEVELARQSFEKALNLDPKYSLAHYYLGVHYLKRHSGKAKKYLTKFINLETEEGNEKLIENAERLLKKL
jgi:Tfp pilus assembly protein PilF